MNSLKFELSVEEANLVMAALAKQPFEVVVGLIQKLQKQAGEQSPPAAPGVESVVQK
ncbi:MAG: hypothetical protein ACO3C4_01745 [Candidatus Limnocylindrus sp.]